MAGIVVAQGVVADIAYRNEENGFSVVKLKRDDEKQFLTCVGIMPGVKCGMSLRVEGIWRMHPRFGAQLEVSSYEVVRPVSAEAIVALLGSGLIDGIGEARARRIVEHFGAATIDILDNDPARLGAVSGIGKKTIAKISVAWQRHRTTRDLLLFLQEFGISVNLAAKIYAAYGNEARRIISENPYALIDDIWGVGFAKADAIAKKLGLGHESHQRIKAGILFTLQEALSNGHLFLPRENLVTEAATILGVNHEKVVESLSKLCEERAVLEEEGGAIYLPAPLVAEQAVATMIANRVTQPADTSAKREVERWLASYSMRSGWKGDKLQIEAAIGAIANPLFLLTGGPGTGKTTTLQVVVSYFCEHHAAVALAAPTGRAAQRMGSIAGIKAQTIHRLLEFKPGSRGFQFSRNAANPIDASVVIIDEISMVDIFLMRSLLTALAPSTRLILVGDHHQLPSVGPGAVLAALVSNAAIPHVHLTTIFRQAAQSTIVRAAHQIIRGIVPQFSNSPNDTCFLMREEDPDRCLAMITDLVANRLPKRYGFDPVADIQVLSPMHKGTLGTQNLNRHLQQILNPARARLVRGETVFCPGDKVMQVRNNYEKGIFNGDIGFVTDILDDTSLRVDFDGRLVDYDGNCLDEVVHAYCISIHKSQGCEFRAVVIPLVSQHYIMLQRNLLYTAITRAREVCLIVGSPSALSIAVRNVRADSRNTRLAERIKRCIDRGECHEA